MTYHRLFAPTVATREPEPPTPIAHTGNIADMAETEEAALEVFPTLAEKLGEIAPVNQPFGEYETITRLDQLDEYVQAAFAAGVVAVDTETTSLQPVVAGLAGISLCVTPGRACYVPTGHSGTAEQLPESVVLLRLKPLLEDGAVLKVLQNAKFDWRVFKRRGVAVRPIDDTMLMSYVLDAAPRTYHGMDDLSERRLGHKPITFEEVTTVGRKRIGFAQVQIDKATEYAAEDADVTMRLWRLLKPRLAASGLAPVYEALELPMIEVLARMEDRGVMVDRQALAELSSEFAGRIKTLGREIDELAGKPLNPNSPKQLGKVLFTDAGVPALKLTEKNKISTDVEVLEKLAKKGHALPAKVIEWRGLSKLKSTYSDALQKAAINERVHTSFNLAGTATGRLSSSDPNLQNIPIKSKDGRECGAPSSRQKATRSWCSITRKSNCGYWIRSRIFRRCARRSSMAMIFTPRQRAACSRSP